MAMMSDLSPELVEEILFRVPLISLRAVRSTCKKWHATSKDQIVCKAKARHQFLGFMMKDFRVCSARFNLHNKDGNFVDPSIKQIAMLDQVNVCKIYDHCDGLLLCVADNDKKLMVWNPYMNQTRWIKPRTPVSINRYGFGYDSRRRHKILRFFDDSLGDLFISVYKRTFEYEIYDFDSDSWRVLDVTNRDWHVRSAWFRRGVSLKGNTYWIANKKVKEIVEGGWEEDEHVPDEFLLCFDFTRERFGPRLKLPLGDFFDGSLSSVREEQLTVLFQPCVTDRMEIWVTTKIEPQAVSWSKFLVFGATPTKGLVCAVGNGNFLIDEEKKVALLFESSVRKYGQTPRRNMAYIIGEDEYYKEVDLGEAQCEYCHPIVCSYVPSLVQIEETEGAKRKIEEDGKLKQISD